MFLVLNIIKTSITINIIRSYYKDYIAVVLSLLNLRLKWNHPVKLTYKIKFRPLFEYMAVPRTCFLPIWWHGLDTVQRRDAIWGKMYLLHPYSTHKTLKCQSRRKATVTPNFTKTLSIDDRRLVESSAACLIFSSETSIHFSKTHERTCVLVTVIVLFKY